LRRFTRSKTEAALLANAKPLRLALLNMWVCPLGRRRARNRWRIGGALEAETFEIEEFNAPIFRLQPAWILIFYEGLKIPRGKTRAGSIPASGTIS
jgi:hypothetical protein